MGNISGVVNTAKRMRMRMHKKNDPEALPLPGRVFQLLLQEPGVPGSGFVTVTKPHSRCYFACMVLMSATLPARWHSVHCSVLARAVVRAS